MADDLWINVDAWRATMTDVGQRAASAAFDLVARSEGWPFNGRLAPPVAAFFVQVRPNVWAPSPRYFVLNDPGLEGADAPPISCAELLLEVSP